MNSWQAKAYWICDGDPLTVEQFKGAVDISGLQNGIANSSEGTLPGDGILLKWRGMKLQLPRTNNAGIPSYTDGRWWWKEENPSLPEFKERRNKIITHECIMDFESDLTKNN